MVFLVQNVNGTGSAGSNAQLVNYLRFHCALRLKSAFFYDIYAPHATGAQRWKSQSRYFDQFGPKKLVLEAPLFLYHCFMINGNNVVNS